MTVRLPVCFVLGALLLVSSSRAQEEPDVRQWDPALGAPAVPVAAPVAAAAPLRIVLTESAPMAVRGVLRVETTAHVLELPGERVGILRARGQGVSQSVRADVQAWAARVSHAPEDARFVRVGEGWELRERRGMHVDVDATLAAVDAALRDPTAVRVDAAATVTQPARTLDHFLSRGVTDVLAVGESSYRGSPAARRENIHAGARRFQDRMVSGDVFSFNAVLGDISRARGFVTGKVISGDRTVSGLGGGICQVSTTVFRALYRAGLPVVFRKNHSYQVHYYDPQGFDAAIYQPSQDLKMRNDTGGDLWFQSEWNDATGALSVAVFGTPRAETVEISPARVVSRIPPLRSRTVIDPTLRRGARVQIEWAAPGGVLELTRTFKRAGVVVRREVLRSTYRPWGNVYATR